MNNENEDKSFEVISISDHKRDWKERFTIHHSATAIIKNYDTKDKEKAASEVSIKAGYHPGGYGIYHRFTQIKPTGNENEYLVIWQTSDSCD